MKCILDRVATAADSLVNHFLDLKLQLCTLTLLDVWLEVGFNFHSSNETRLLSAIRSSYCDL